MARSTRSTGQRPVSLNLVRLEDRLTPHHDNAFTHVLPQNENYTGDPVLIDAAAVSLPNGGPIAYTNDGTGRIAQGSLPGSAPMLRIFDVNGTLIREIEVYAGTFKGGVRVDAKDVTGDGIDDFLTSPGDGGGPHVIAIDGASYQTILSTFGIDDPDFRGGAYAAFGKMGNQFVIITIAGEGGGPRLTIKTLEGRVLVNIFVYAPNLRDGGTVDTEDVDGDGFDDLVTAPGKGGSSHIKVIRGKVLIETGGTVSSFVEWFAENPAERAGANAVVGLLGDPCGAPLVITSSRPGSLDPTWFKGWNPLNGQLLFSGQIPGWPKMGAFGAIRSARTAADRPSIFISAWLEGGDKVFEYQLPGYDFQRYDCDPIAVVPPVPPPPPPPTADLSVRKTANKATAQVGESVTFTVSVTNDGPNTAQGVFVNDPLVSGFSFQSATASAGSYNETTGRWDLGSLNNGGSATLTITATVSATGNLTNTATASASVGDPDPSDNTASVAVTGTPVPPPPPPPLSADLHVTKQVNDNTVTVGDTIVYTIQVRNDGPDSATNVVITDNLPFGFSSQSVQASVGAYNAVTGIWNVGTLANGQVATLTITGTITTSGNIVNTASVASAVGDPDTADNTAAVTVTATPAPPPLTQLSANGLFFLVDTPGDDKPVMDVAVGIGPVTFQRLVVTLGTGLWTNVTDIKLKIQGALPSDPTLGATYTVDPTGTILTIDGIAFPITTPSETFRLTADVNGAAVPLQVTSVRAYGHA